MKGIGININIDNERELFEAWTNKNVAQYLKVHNIKKDTLGNYENNLTHCQWEGWQARANIKSDVKSEAVAEVKTEEVEYLFDHKLYLHPEQINQALIAYVKELREYVESFHFSVDEKSFYKDVAFVAINPHSIMYRLPIDSTKSFIFSDIEKRRNEAIAIPESLKSLLGE